MTSNKARREEPCAATLAPKVLHNALLLIWMLNSSFTNGFVPTTRNSNIFVPTRIREPISTSSITITSPSQPSNSQLNVFFFGGTPEVEITTSGDSCELVEIRIEKISSNSRRIAGEVTVEAPIDDVWAILTDYDNLSTHVPNLVESRRKRNGKGEQGDGSYTCQLYQKGAQKIIGFEFGASVTMEMKEKTMVSERSMGSALVPQNRVVTPKEKLIEFKCVDSQFFSEFDGEWRVKSTEDGLGSILNYVVDVRPKGPVPVAALEWRIREDVPTNLRAVKKAAVDVGREGVMKMRRGGNSHGSTVRRAIARNVRTISDSASVGSERAKDVVGRVVARANGGQQPQMTPIRVPVWDDEETMAVYFNSDP